MNETDLSNIVDFVISKNSGGHVLDLFQIVDDTIAEISAKNGRIDMLEYSLQSKVSLKQVADIAHGLKRDSEAEIIDAYIKKYEVDFELYHKDDYVGKINSNGKVFGEDEEMQLEKYLQREKLPSLVGVVMPVIYKILNDEELPSRKSEIKKLHKVAKKG